MFSVQVKYKGRLVRLMRNKKLDNLIPAFIKESQQRAKKTKTCVTEGKTHFYLFHDDNPIGMMVWAMTNIDDKEQPVLILTRDDRSGNLYIYDTDGYLVKHKSIQ